MIKLNIVKISLTKTLLRPFAILMVFLPVFFNNFDVINDKIIGLWIIFWIIFFIILLNFQKRYSKIGSIMFYLDRIEYRLKNDHEIIFVSDNLVIDINYKGYQNEIIKYSFPFYISLSGKEGIAQISINKMKNKFNVIIENKNIISFLNFYKDKYALKKAILNIVIE